VTKRKHIALPPRVKDLTGTVFGKLTVIEFAGLRPRRDGHRAAWWHCRCECGITVECRANTLANGDKRACTPRCKNLRHGHAADKQLTPEYHCWTAIKYRCNNPRFHAYSRYGGRGIRVCKRWMESFENFLSDMGPRPYSMRSIDRIDNDGNYEPSNCRWATNEQQQNNRSDCTIIEHDGIKQSATQWSRQLGISIDAIYGRIKAGWDTERILTTPLRKQRRPVRRKTVCRDNV